MASLLFSQSAFSFNVCRFCLQALNILASHSLVNHHDVLFKCCSVTKTKQYSPISAKTTTDVISIPDKGYLIWLFILGQSKLCWGLPPHKRKCFVCDVFHLSSYVCKDTKVTTPFLYENNFIRNKELGLLVIKIDSFILISWSRWLMSMKITRLGLEPMIYRWLYEIPIT